MFHQHLLRRIVFGGAAVAAAGGGSIAVPPYSNDNAKLLSAFLSLSYELADFPDYAGTRSQPNQYSVNLLENIGQRQIYMPVSRVGGNSQDRAIYDPYLVNATAPSCDTAPTAILCIGKSFFESYGSFPNTKYSHGFNLAWNNASGYATLQETVPLACKALGSQLLEAWELGNEPDLYRGKWRPSNWTVEEYLQDWFNGTSHIRSYLQEACPELASPQFFSFLNPSVSSPGSGLNPTTIADDGEQSSAHPVKEFSVHNYITGANSPGVTLANSLLNHQSTVNSLEKHVQVSDSISQVPGFEKTPYVIGECNSLYGGGRAGLSNVFGSALWVVDFTLYGASTGAIHRMHYHQSPTAPYAAWVPSGVNATTNPAYYGKLAAAQFLGDSTHRSVSSITLPGGSEAESAYAGYNTWTRQLDRLAVLNMNEFNSTESGSRPSINYSFAVSNCSVWKVERLTAPGSNVLTGVTFDGIAYDYDTLGKPKRVSAPNGYIAANDDGILSFGVQDSEAVILTAV